MSLGRWWERIKGSARSEAPATAAAPLTATPTRPIAPAPPSGAAVPVSAPEVPAPIEVLVELPLGERNVRFFCWMVGVATKAGAAPPPQVILEQMFLQLD